jgi:hypothetical protein
MQKSTVLFPQLRCEGPTERAGKHVCRPFHAFRLAGLQSATPSPVTWCDPAGVPGELVCWVLFCPITNIMFSTCKSTSHCLLSGPPLPYRRCQRARLQWCKPCGQRPGRQGAKVFADRLIWAYALILKNTRLYPHQVTRSHQQ